jgi:hypothetical protein
MSLPNKSPPGPNSALPWTAKGQSVLIEPSATTQHTIGFFESREDAAYAVRAANAHTPLLEAAQQARAMLAPAPGGAERPIVKLLDAAIRGAEPT